MSVSVAVPTSPKDAIAQSLSILAAQLEAGNSAALTKYLAFVSRFHAYSFGNIMAIAMQKPDATHVAGFHTWKSLGRNVRKGEKAIRIMAPMVAGRKDAAESDADTKGHVIGFRSVCVFDVSQTDGEDLPQFSTAKGDAGTHIEKLAAFAESQGIAVEYVDDLDGAKGMSYGGRIALLNGQVSAELFTTFAHELAHEILHKGEKRKGTSKDSRELEAEAIAFVIGSHIGLDLNTSSVDYIKLYNGDKDALAGSLEAITRASTAILEALAA